MKPREPFEYYYPRKGFKMKMRTKILSLFALLLFIAVVSVPIQGQDGKAIVAAAKAMGAENLKTLQLTGSGSTAGLDKM